MMTMPKVVRYDFPLRSYLMLDEGQENDVLKEVYLVEPVEVETIVETEEGSQTVMETRYKILRKVYEDTGLEPMGTQEAAIRRATSELWNQWASKTGTEPE